MMMKFVAVSFGILFCISSANASVPASTADDPSTNDITSAAAFGRMPIERVKVQIQHWLTLSRASEAMSKAVMEPWSNREQVDQWTAEQTLDRLIDSFAIADKSVRELVELCRATGQRRSLEFEGARADRFFRDHVSLYHARWLTQHRFYN